jgi:hypothetical protein
MTQPASPRRFSTHTALALAALLLASPLYAKDDCPATYWDYPMKKTIKLAEKGCLNAIVWMTAGNYIDPKLGNIEKSPEEQIMWLERATAAGHAVSMLDLATILAFGQRNGRTMPHDETKALQYAEAALATGRLVSSTVHPAHDTRGRAVQLIADLKQMAAVRGQTATDGAAAFTMFGIMSRYNIGSERDRWLRAAADLDHKDAMNILLTWNEKDDNIRYQYGARYIELYGPRSKPEENVWVADQVLFTKKDLARAKAVYKQLLTSNDQGISIAHRLLADAKTYALMDSALIGNSAEAQLLLGDEFLKKNAGPRETDFALRFYYLAYDQDNLIAASRVMQYATTLGAQRRAAQFLADRGDAQAAAFLANAAAYDKEWRRQYDQKLYDASVRAYAVAKQRESGFVERIEREGTNDAYEVEVYCMYGGSRCQTLRAQVLQKEKSQNAAWEAANARRLQQVYSGGAGSTDAQFKARSDCMQRKTQAIQNNTKGQADYFNADCNSP